MNESYWISAFLDAQAAERGAATNTQLAYARDLADFTDWLTRQGSCLSDAKKSDVESYLVSCDAQGLAKSTRARRLSAIKQLYRFCFEEGFRSDNPAVQISGPGRMVYRSMSGDTPQSNLTELQFPIIKTKKKRKKKK